MIAPGRQRLLRLARRSLSVAGCVILAAAALIELNRLIAHLWFLAGGGIRGDAIYYFGMGRGLLNGLRLYADLFETKPPLVFWLSSLSLAMGGDARVYLATQALLLVGIPLTLSAFVHRLGQATSCRITASVAALLWGAALASLVADRGQGFQTEGFAVLPAAVPALVLAWGRERGRRTWTWLSATAFSVAILLKEPFLIAGIAAMVWMVQTRRDLLWALQVTVVTGFLALLFLVATGTASDYFGIYLPEILQGRLYDNIVYHDYRIDRFVQIPTPTLLRGLDLTRLFRDVFPGTPFWMLGVATAGLLLGRPWWFNRSHWCWRLAATAAITALILSSQKAYELRQVVVLIEQLGRPLPWTDPFFRVKVVELVGLAALGLGSLGVLAWSRQWRLLAESARVLGILYLATLVASLAGDSPAHHALFAVPVYLAVVADGLLRWGRGEGGRPATALIASAAVALVIGAIGSRYDYDRLRPEQAALVSEQQREQATAGRLDALLSACGDARYVLADHRIQRLQALTRHSPVQLSYGMQRAFEDRGHRGFQGRPANPVFQAKMEQDLATTRVFVFGSGTGRLVTIPGVEDRLASGASEAPECARPFLPISGLELSFQKVEPR